MVQFNDVNSAPAHLCVEKCFLASPDPWKILITGSNNIGYWNSSQFT